MARKTKSIKDDLLIQHMFVGNELLANVVAQRVTSPVGGRAHGKADDLTIEVETVAGILGIHVEERVLLAALHEMRMRHRHEMLVDIIVEVHGFIDGDVSMGRAPVHVRRGSWRRAC